MKSRLYYKHHALNQAINNHKHIVPEEKLLHVLNEYLYPSLTYSQSHDKTFITFNIIVESLYQF